MPKKKLSPIMEKQLRAMLRELPNLTKLAANESVNFFTENFRRQGFLDRSLEKWKPRKNNIDPGRGILIGKANRGGRGLRLSRSIARKSLTATRAIIGVKGGAGVYAGVHNYGLMAGSGAGFKMPKRQFIGRSKKLDDKIIRLFRRRLNRIL